MMAPLSTKYKAHEYEPYATTDQRITEEISEILDDCERIEVINALTIHDADFIEFEVIDDEPAHVTRFEGNIAPRLREYGLVIDGMVAIEPEFEDSGTIRWRVWFEYLPELDEHQ